MINKKTITKFFFLICIASLQYLSCTSVNKMQKNQSPSLFEETGIIILRNEDFNWFVPLVNSDSISNLLQSLTLDNIKTGVQFEFRHDNKYFEFLTQKDIPKEIYKTDDGVRLELIPVKIKYRKFIHPEYLDCEKDLRKNSFTIDKIRYEYSINSCICFIENITTLILNK